MASLWPWLAVAGVGALHGLNPATGWMFAAAWGLRAHDRRQALRALAPIGIGHAASVALVAAAVALGLSMDRVLLQAGAGVLFAAVTGVHLAGLLRRRAGHGPARWAARTPTGHAGLALWSFMMSTAHGAGLMLVPALIPPVHGRCARGPGDHRVGLAAAGVRGGWRSLRGNACHHVACCHRCVPRLRRGHRLAARLSPEIAGGGACCTPVALSTFELIRKHWLLSDAVQGMPPTGCPDATGAAAIPTLQGPRGVPETGHMPPCYAYLHF
jgi:hypothetical protein